MNKLPDLVSQFLEYLTIERNVSPLTVRNYKHYLGRFMSWLLASSSTLPQVENIKEDTIRRYRVFLSRLTDGNNLTLSKSTQNYHLIALRMFLKFLARRDIVTLTAEKIDLGKAQSISLKFLNQEQLTRLLNQPDMSTPQGNRDKAILELLFSTGLRISELVHLNKGDINFESREIGIIGKGGRPRVVFISDSAAKWIRHYLSARSDNFKPLFIRYSGKKIAKDVGDEGYRLTPRSIERAVEKYVKKARLPIKITPHGLRHTFATDLLTNGADLRAIQEMLGHKNISTTQIYTHVTNPQLKDIHKKFHGKDAVDKSIT